MPWRHSRSGAVSTGSGWWTLIVAVLCSTLFAPLVFLGGFYPALGGMALWGIGMGAQESILRAAIAGMIPRIAGS